MLCAAAVGVVVDVPAVVEWEVVRNAVPKGVTAVGRWLGYWVGGGDQVGLD